MPLLQLARLCGTRAMGHADGPAGPLQGGCPVHLILHFVGEERPWTSTRGENISAPVVPGERSVELALRWPSARGRLLGHSS